MSDQDTGFRQLGVLLPFLLVTLIWGSTWIVIRDQLGPVPPAWSIAYRFAIAATAMFAYSAATGISLNIGRNGHALALMFGLSQFFLNFNFVYLAEHHITSGLVAVVFALLLVPNSALGWLFLRHRTTGRFLAGSAVAVVGVALLFIHEMRGSNAASSEVVLGIGLTILGVLSASAANVMQASESLRRRPIAAMLAWGMTYGVIANVVTAWLFYGPPSIEYRLGYWVGLLYLGLLASALAFTFYFSLIRKIGPAKAAYSSVLVPVIAMTLSTLFEGYRWSTLAAAGGLLALAGLVIALRAGKTIQVAERPDLKPD
ncbi:DMT family transporter [Sphingosinicella rhizophila]|uniref:EamA family transporter n=1 Tax=Sphingosinicella rhizophila TaxID=3050082 RepID=A0ABU3Q7E8_9SPHN|nr:EamA family transporter [Sphingosinicella sp. GR2756]MDT9599311.1 EamA family transporter [Sphingosinicella sp. GR2756]